MQKIIYSFLLLLVLNFNVFAKDIIENHAEYSCESPQKNFKIFLEETRSSNGTEGFQDNVLFFDAFGSYLHPGFTVAPVEDGTAVEKIGRKYNDSPSDMTKYHAVEIHRSSSGKFSVQSDEYKKSSRRSGSSYKKRPLSSKNNADKVTFLVRGLKYSCKPTGKIAPIAQSVDKAESVNKPTLNDDLSANPNIVRSATDR
jgi:hypothetical protein